MSQMMLLLNAAGEVVNIIIIEHGVTYQPPSGHEVASPSPGVGIGWSRVDGQWVQPAEASQE